jgi:hypothetical protein
MEHVKREFDLLKDTLSTKDLALRLSQVHEEHVGGGIPPDYRHWVIAPKVKFGARMRRSYKVEIQGILYKNDRPPHVETVEEIAPDTIFMLSKIGHMVTHKDGKHIVMFNLEGLHAHLTVYVGFDHDEATSYLNQFRDLT